MAHNIRIASAPFLFEEMRSFVLKSLSEKLSENLLYHDLNHVLDVEKSVVEIAEREGLNLPEILLIRTAALYHDFGFIERYQDNEEFAIQQARKDLPQFQYTSAQIELIAEMIHSTRLGLDAKNLYDEILSDADHDYFGRADYFEIAHKLRIELERYGRTFDEKEWLQFQLDYLENEHRFQTVSAREKGNEGKQKNILELKAKFNQLNT